MIQDQRGLTPWLPPPGWAGWKKNFKPRGSMRGNGISRSCTCGICPRLIHNTFSGCSRFYRQGSGAMPRVRKTVFGWNNQTKIATYWFSNTYGKQNANFVIRFIDWGVSGGKGGDDWCVKASPSWRVDGRDVILINVKDLVGRSDEKTRLRRSGII